MVAGRLCMVAGICGGERSLWGEEELCWNLCTLKTKRQLGKVGNSPPSQISDNTDTNRVSKPGSGISLFYP